jgi:hypothetical protein
LARHIGRVGGFDVESACAVAGSDEHRVPLRMPGRSLCSVSLVELVEDLTVWPGLVLDKPPFRVSVVVPIAGHNLNADRPFACSGKRVDDTLADDVPYLNLVCFCGQD